ncbi:hypothetical protein RchiOBHm_Chr5g0077801 [Rosa chinensis]|uniref:Uncharacterized protein n=1 Tax=Rosa chinensis TaxID=74649 RepID=A0A2P6QM54_ROSCH|nr:hypothetical protein RchiOBHm_Chr5g0077801 [Rosa chinensis]
MSCTEHLNDHTSSLVKDTLDKHTDKSLHHLLVHSLNSWSKLALSLLPSLSALNIFLLVIFSAQPFA